MPAFEEAAAMGVDGVETDLRHTRDGRIVILHDDTIAGVPVEDMTLADVRDAVGMMVPTLEDVLERDWRISWNLEVKTREAWVLMRPMSASLPGGTLVTSFIHGIAEAAALNGLEAGILNASIPIGPVPQAGARLRTCVFDARVLDADEAASWHAAGWGIATYATNGEARHRAAMAMRPTIVITDEIEIAMRLVQGYPS